MRSCSQALKPPLKKVCFLSSGGQNCGQSGSRKIFLFPLTFFYSEENNDIFELNKTFFNKSEKKIPVGAFIHTPPLHQKQLFLRMASRLEQGVGSGYGLLGGGGGGYPYKERGEKYIMVSLLILINTTFSDFKINLL